MINRFKQLFCKHQTIQDFGICKKCGWLDPNWSAEAIVDAHCPWLNEDYRKNFLEHIRLDGEITMMTKRIKFEMVSE